jgi:nifR3 family TIM-barrel protein
VNKVVAKNGGSALLKDCPTLTSVAAAVVRGVAPLPVTAKIRIGWDADSINAVRVAKLLEEQGIAALTVHGRTRAQGYSGSADWEVIAAVAAAVAIPVIGNGDLVTPADVARRRAETDISGVMIGRAAMSSPWIFQQTKHYLATGELLPPPAPAEKWDLILRHCRLTVESWGDEEKAIRSMRARLMAYSKGFPGSKILREQFQQVSTISDVAMIAETHLQTTSEALATAS